MLSKTTAAPITATPLPDSRQYQYINNLRQLTYLLTEARIGLR